jgi:hypothetical protein
MVKTIEVLVSFSLKMVLSGIRQKSMPDRITFNDNNGEFFYPNVDKGIWAVKNTDLLWKIYFIGKRFSNQTDCKYIA